MSQNSRTVTITGYIIGIPIALALVAASCALVLAMLGLVFLVIASSGLMFASWLMIPGTPWWYALPAPGIVVAVLLNEIRKVREKGDAPHEID